jgi:hypothetical protein
MPKDRVTLQLTPTEQQVCEKLALATGYSVVRIASQAFKTGLLLSLRELIRIQASLDVTELAKRMIIEVSVGEKDVQANSN